MFTLTSSIVLSLAASAVTFAAPLGVVHVQSAGPWTKPSASRRIVVLGDSLSVTPNRQQSFPSLLEARLEAAGPPWSMINAGVSGDATAGGLARFDRAVPAGTDILVLALGANDGLRGLEVSGVERRLATMIERAQARGIAVLLCGMETPPRRGWSYTLAFHEIYPRLAARYRVPLVPFLLEGVALIAGMNGPDGVHPNATGAQRIADNVWPYLEPLLRSSVPTGR
jgi:acyl-CoA thioesterase-1